MRTHLALLAPVAFAVVGCSSSSPFMPGISFSNLDVKYIDWEMIDTDFVFEVNNPNPVTIALDRFDYSLAFEGIEWVSGDNADGLALTALDDTAWALPVNIDFMNLYDTIQAVRGEDNVDFELAGSVGFDTDALGPIDIPYDTMGDFPALRIPQFSISKLNSDSIDWSNLTVDMALQLDVDNDHASTLNFFNMDYGIELAGSEITSGFLSSLGYVDGGTSSKVEIPFTVDLLNIGTSAYDIIIGGGSAAVALTSSMEVDTPFEVVPLTIQISQGNVQIQ